MFGTLGGPELFLIFVVALIVFGPRKLPEIGKSLGRMMSEFRRASNDFRSTIESEVEAEKIRDSMRIEAPRASSSSSPASPPSSSRSPAPTAGDSPGGGPPKDRTPGDESSAAGAPGPADSETSSPAGDEASPEKPPRDGEREPVAETVSREPSSRPVEPS